MSDRPDLDAPKPPGGPQRTDAPAGPDTPGEAGLDPGPRVRRVTRPDSEGVVEEPDVRTPTQTDEERRLQEENAKTHLEEPSDSSGGE